MPGALLRSLLISALVGCGARVDPFAADRQLRTDVSGPPHLALAIGDALLADVVRGLLPTEALETPGPLGMSLRITPEIDEVHVALTETDVCADCVDLEVTAAGTANLRTALLSAPAIPWEVRAGAPIRLESNLTDDGLRIEARWGALPVRTTVELGHLPPTLEALVSGFIAGWLQTTLTEVLREPLHVATLDTTAVPLLQIRPVPGDVIRIDAYVSAPVDAEELAVLPPPKDGWVLVIPNATVLALARHNAMRDADKMYFIEPTVLQVDGASLTAQIRIWRAGRREHYKSILVEGIVRVRGGALIIEPTLADPFASMRWKGGLDTAILTAKLRKWVEKGEIRIPGSLTTPAGKIRLTHVEGQADHIVLRGTFTPSTP